MTTIARPLVPRHSALVVMDYQPVVLDSMPDSEALIKNTREAIDIIRDRKGQVAFVRIGLDENDYQFVPPSNQTFAAVAAGKYLNAQAPETAFHSDLAPRPGDIAVRKTRVGAFTTTNLDEEFTNRGITTLILAGVHTGGVMLSTVREAADRDYRLVILSDCTSDPDPEVHDLLIGKIFPKQTHIITVSQLDSLFSEA
jgi:nicotinamidase-related amidase